MFRQGSRDSQQQVGKAAPILSLEAVREALTHESDLSLLTSLRDELNARCKELEKEIRKESNSWAEADSTCSTTTDSESEADMDSIPSSPVGSMCSTKTDTESEGDIDSAEAESESEAEVDTSPLSSLESIPRAWDFGLFGPRSSKMISGYSLGMKLGVGRFATVYRATNQTGRKEAVKVISKKEVDVADDWANVANEYKTLSSLGPHPNIVCLTGAVQSTERLYFFMDLAEGQDLFDYINLRGGVSLAQEVIQSISSSILSALAHCHGQGTCHRDLKPENIIVQQDKTAKLVDFGCACPCHQPQGPRCVGTLPFIAPECLSGQSRDGAAADVWSFGVVILEMKFGLNALSRFFGWSTFAQPPLGDCGSQLTDLFADPSQGLDQIRSKFRAIEKGEGDEVLASMLHADPLERPLAADALA